VKKILLTLLAVAALVGVLAGIGFGSAADIGGVQADYLQAGVGEVTPGDGVAVEYSTHFGFNMESYVYGIKVTGVDAPAGNWVLVGLFSGPGSIIRMLHGLVQADQTATMTEVYDGGWQPYGTFGNSYEVLSSAINDVSIVVKSTPE
jgi:hypothetical protein